MIVYIVIGVVPISANPLASQRKQKENVEAVVGG